MPSLRTRFTVLLSCLAGLALVAPSGAGAAAPTSGATPGQSTYVPVTPSRVMDTRDGTGGHSGPLGAGEMYDLALGLPAEATAAVLNVTATRATASTVIRVYPAPASGTVVPLVSNLNVVAGATVADLVVTKLGSGGAVRFHNNAGTTELIADLAGYYVAGGAQAGFTGTAPVRLLDTRQTGSPLGGGEARALALSTRADGSPSPVPGNATAVVLNLTAVSPTVDTNVRAYPGSAVPTVSNLNPARGTTVANLAVVATAAPAGTPEVTLRNDAGSVHLVVDLAGWYVAGDGDVFHPVDPYRALDTRGGNPVSSASPGALQLAGSMRVPYLASSIAATVTAVSATQATYVTAYPAGPGDPPTASNLNLLAGQTVPNATVVAAGKEGFVSLAVGAGSVHLIVDVAGWFGPAGEGYDISWPQCTPGRTGTSSNHPPSGAFAVIGLTNGKPYTDNACLADEFAWAESLPGGGAGYIILNAPGQGDANWGANRSPQACDGTTSVGCGYDYGWWAATYAITNNRLPLSADGGRPQVWLDVEGQYASGPVWQATLTSSGGYTYSAEQQAVNAAVVRGARDRLRSAGIRTGVYSRKQTTNAGGTRTDDWYRLTGALALNNVQQWVFPRPTDPDEANNPPSDARKAELAHVNCNDARIFTGGFVVLSQYQNQVNGTTFDVNHPC